MLTTTLPNHILQDSKDYQLIHDEKFIVAKSTTYKKGKTFFRNSMHILLLPIKGQKILHLKEEERWIDSTEILYLAQGNYFLSEIVDKKSQFESILIFFDDNFVLEFIQKYDIHIEVTTQSILVLKKDNFMHSVVVTMNDYFKTDMDDKLSLCKLKTEELFLYSLSQNRKDFLALLNHIVTTKPSRIKYILESNLDIISSVEDMSKLTRQSVHSLRKEMMRLYGKRPKEWLDQKRLEKAVNLLKNSSQSISSIATACGYSSVSWFIIQFKKYYKTTPLHFREENL